MAIPVANTTLLNTYQYMINRVNELANNMTLWTLTTDGNTSWTVPAGNSAITGTFSCNTVFVGNSTVSASLFGANSTLVVNSAAHGEVTTNTAVVNTYVQVGNSTVNAVVNTTAVSIANSTASITLAAPTPAQISNGQYFLAANGAWTLRGTTTAAANTNGTSTQLIDTWLIASYRTADYIVHVEDLNNNNHVSSRLFAMHDNTNGYVTEYATIVTNTAIGVFTVTTNATSLLLNFTPNAGYNNTTISYTRTLLG